MKPKESDLTTIATFADGVEASIAQQTLAAEGIDAYVHGDAMATTMWHLGVALGGVKLQVAAKDEAQALQIIDEARSGSLANHGTAEEEEEGDDDDQIDSATASQDEATLRVLKAAIFGLLFPPLTFYAGWLLLQFQHSDEVLSDKNRSRKRVASVLVIIALCWYMFCLAVFLQNLRDPYLGEGIPLKRRVFR